MNDIRFILTSATIKYRKDKDYYCYTFQDINGSPIYYEVVTATPNFSFRDSYTLEDLRIINKEKIN